MAGLVNENYGLNFGLSNGTNFNPTSEIKSTYTPFEYNPTMETHLSDYVGTASTPTGLSDQNTSFLGNMFKKYNTNTGNYDWDYGSIGSTALGIGQLGLGLYNAALGRQSLKDAKALQQFQMNAYNRNLANTAKTINNAYDNAARANAGIAGHADDSSDLARAEKQHVDGSAVGTKNTSGM